MDELLQEFVNEAEEMLEGLRAALDDVEAGGGEEALHRAYRAVHVLRGGAGFLGLERMERLAAAGEGLFSGPGGPAVVSSGRELHGRLADLLGEVREGGAEPEGDDGDLLARLGSSSGGP